MRYICLQSLFLSLSVLGRGILGKLCGWGRLALFVIVSVVLQLNDN